MKNSKTFAALAAAIMAVSSIGVVAYADAATESAAAPVATESTAPAETPAESQVEAVESAAPAESQAEESKAEESKAEESKAEESTAPAESKAEESKAEESKAEESKAEESKTESKATESKKDETSSKADAVIAKILYDAFTGNEFAYDANGNFLAAYSNAGARLDNVKPSGILYGFAGEDKTAGDIVFYDASNGLKVVKTVVRSSVTGPVADFAKTVINDLNKTASKTTGTASKTESKKDDKSSSKSEEKKKDNPKTGNTAANSIVGLVTLAGAAAVAVISRKERD